MRIPLVAGPALLLLVLQYFIPPQNSQDSEDPLFPRPTMRGGVVSRRLGQHQSGAGLAHTGILGSFGWCWWYKLAMVLE